jgi:hypothetical protein
MCEDQALGVGDTHEQPGGLRSAADRSRQVAWRAEQARQGQALHTFRLPRNIAAARECVSSFQTASSQSAAVPWPHCGVHSCRESTTRVQPGAHVCAGYKFHIHIPVLPWSAATAHSGHLQWLPPPAAYPQYTTSEDRGKGPYSQVKERVPEAPAMPPAPRWQLLLPSRRFQARGLLNKQVAAEVVACAVSCAYVDLV